MMNDDRISKQTERLRELLDVREYTEEFGRIGQRERLESELYADLNFWENLRPTTVDEKDRKDAAIPLLDAMIQILWNRRREGRDLAFNVNPLLYEKIIGHAPGMESAKPQAAQQYRNAACYCRRRSDQNKLLAVALRLEGLTTPQVAAELNITDRSVRRCVPGGRKLGQQLGLPDVSNWLPSAPD